MGHAVLPHNPHPVSEDNTTTTQKSKSELEEIQANFIRTP
jgi:hypothetical protein